MLIYIGIFCAKIVEISIMTIRTVLMTRGEKVYAAVLGFFEITLWLILVSTVVTNISADPIRILVYALGFACGIFIGSVLEEKLGVGIVTVHVTSSTTKGMEIAKVLREKGVAVTNLKGEGRDEGKSVLLIHVKRRKKGLVIKAVNEIDENALVNMYDVKNVFGGYGLKK